MAANVVVKEKGRLDFLKEASGDELLAELARRRKAALELCSDDELNEALSKCPGYDGPRYVEK